MTHPTTQTRSVVVEREIPHPPQKIWRALTQSHLIAEWLMKNDFEAREGHRFSLTADWGQVDCAIQTLEPHKTLSYAWDTKDLRSVVTWTLTPTPNGTLLRMQQEGFRPSQKAYYQGATVGWPRFISQLERVLERLD